MAQLGRLYKYALDTKGKATSGVSLAVYREGATVNGSQSGTSPLTVTVFHNGKIKQGDTVFFNSTTTTTATVGVVTSTTIALSGFSGTLNLLDGDRIVPSNLQPTLYSNDQGSTSTTNPLTSSSLGLWQCSLEFGAYDMLQSGGGLSTILHQGQVIGSEVPGQIRFADDFSAASSTGGIQEAIDDLPTTGGRVICSAKTYTTSSTIWLHSGVHLQGAGMGATIIQRASGSYTNGSANNSGGTVDCGPKGSNGSEFTSGSNGSNISVSNITLDGNYTAFSSLTNANLTPNGFRAVWVVGLTLTNVKVQNTLMDGFYIASCNNLVFTGLYADTVGQWGTTSSRNGLSLYNDTSSTNTNSGVVSNFLFKTVGSTSIGTGAEGITLSGCQGLDISNGSVDGCGFGIEFTSVSTIQPQDINISNISFRNLLSYGITFNATAADVSKVNFTNLTFNCHSTLHDAGVIFMSTAGCNISDVSFNNISAININSKDTNAKNWIDIQSASGKSRKRIRFNNISFSGLSTSTRQQDVGITFQHTCTDIYFDTVQIKDVAGAGIIFNTGTADTHSNIHFNQVVVDGANFWGCLLRNNVTTSTIKEIYFNNCVMKDCCKQTGVGNDAGWRLQAAFAGSTLNNVYFRGCRSYKTSGTTHLYGIDLLQTAGTLDSIQISSSDFSGTQTDWFISSGTMTNIHFLSPRGRGSDITSAATIAIPANGNIFHVTAANNITNGITVNPWDNGRRIKLIFDSTPTVSDTGTSVLAGNFAATADDSLTLSCDGTNWNEDARSVN